MFAMGRGAESESGTHTFAALPPSPTHVILSPPGPRWAVRTGDDIWDYQIAGGTPAATI
jgi:hypothetical protein